MKLSGQLLLAACDPFFDYPLIWRQKMADYEFDVWMVAKTINVQSASEHQYSQ